MLIDICLPIYNEEKILTANVLKLLTYLQTAGFFKSLAPSHAWQITLIINGSYDRSSLIANDLQQKYPGKIKIKEFKESGKGRALKEYFLISTAEILVYMDSDLAVALDNLPALLEPILKNEADLVIGSRLLKASKTDRSSIRNLTSQIYNFLARMILRHNFSDSQCGFKAFRKEVFVSVIPQLQDKHWFFDTELLVFSKILKWRIKEIPVDWKEERYQARKSKINFFRDGFRFFYFLLKLKGRLLIKH